MSDHSKRLASVRVAQQKALYLDSCRRLLELLEDRNPLNMQIVLESGSYIASFPKPRIEVASNDHTPTTVPVFGKGKTAGEAVENMIKNAQDAFKKI